MIRHSIRLLSATILCVAAACGAHEDQRPSTLARPGRFYAGRDYGSEDEFNPVSVILNEGFDVLRVPSADRRIGDRVNGRALENVVESVLHADRTYRFYGYGRALRNEWLPLSMRDDRGGGAWIPNYELHLLGSGMASVRAEEWFQQHGISHPLAAAVATMMTAHLLNEIVENGGTRTPNEDAVTDLLIFDPLGILLWRLDAVQRFASGPVQMLDWSGQPTYDYNSKTIQNAGQEFLLRVRIPGTERWRAGYMTGMSSLFFASYGRPQDGIWSAGAGVYVFSNPVVDSITGAKGAVFRPHGGVFYDRDGSLLFSAVYDPRGTSERLTVNLYPGTFNVGDVHPGLWFQTVPHAGLRVGLVSRFGLGIGHGPEH